MPTIRIIIADDHAILRDGIRSLLERQDDMSVVAEASNGREAIERVSELLPDIVLMDVAMPEMNGLDATRQIKSIYPQVKVLILTQHDDREYVAPLLQAGASGYVLKRSGGREVVTAIRQVYEQGAFLEPGLALQVMQNWANPDVQPAAFANPPPVHLTSREMEVLRLIVDGKSNKEIALVLRISPKTVSVHRSNLMIKLDVRTDVELLRYVTQHRLLDTP